MKTLLLSFCILAFCLSGCSSGISPSTVLDQNYLVYLVDTNDQPPLLALYDPAKDIHTAILSDWEISQSSLGDGRLLARQFSLSADHRLAFSSATDGKSDVFILDFPFTEQIPLKVTEGVPGDNLPISWSPDGSLLLIDSNESKLIVWDGETLSEIYQYHEHVSEFSWGPNSQLAFTDFYSFISPPGEDPSEIVIWDGKLTLSASQNPGGTDRFPVWSRDGELAFLSDRNGEYDIFIWDGISIDDKGSPDIDSFTNVAPNLTKYYSDPTWTASGSLAFGGTGGSLMPSQIYEWNAEGVQNISNNNSGHNGGATWRSDGYWAFVTYFSSEQNLFIRNANNQTVLTTSGMYTPAWSENGFLLFCVKGSSGWILSMWNGSDVVEIVRGNQISAKWPNGAEVVCSSG